MIMESKFNATICIWINSYNEKNHNTETNFYKFGTNSENKNDLSEFFDLILNNIEKLTRHKFSEISSITITTRDAMFNDMYYKGFKSQHPGLNILSMFLEG